MSEDAIQVAPKGAGLSAALDAWRRRKWPAIFIFAAVCTAMVSVAMFLPDMYKSTATILVERQQVPEAFVQSTVTSGLDVRLQTITQQVLSRSRLEVLINRFGLYVDLRQQVPLEEVIESMRKDIVVEQKGQKRQGRDEETIAFSIGYKGKNPQQVAQVANALASFYIDENLKAREQQAAGTADFLHAQLVEVKQRLEEQEQRLSQFKERHMGELPEQLQANIAVLEGLNTQLRSNGDKRTRTSEQRAALARQLAELEGLSPRKSTIDTASNVTPDTPETKAVRLEKLQQTLASLRARYSEKYPDIALLKSEIEALEQQPSAVDSTKKQGKVQEPPPNPYAQQLRKEFSALDVELKLLHTEEENVLRSIALYQQRVEATPRRDQEMQGLQRDYITTRDLYQSLLKRQEEAKLAQHLEQRQKGEQFRLMEPAVPSQRPTEPDRRKLILTGLFAGLGLAIGMIILAEQLDTSFHTADELRAFTPVPILVSLPRIVTRAETRRRRWWFGLAGVSAVLSLVLIVGASYAVIKGPAHLVDLYEQLQHLRQ